MGDGLSSAGKKFGAEASAVGRRTGGGLAHVIKVIIKIFVYFFVGCILLGVVRGAIWIGSGADRFTTCVLLVLDSRYQEILAWCLLIFFIWVPVIAIVTWIIRKLTGKRGNSGKFD